MKKNSIIIIVTIIVLLIIGFLIYNNSKGENQNNPYSNSSVSTIHSSQELFANSALAQNAHLISAPTFDTATEQALSGFTVTKKALPDGSTQITLNSQNSEYQTQTYVVKLGQKLYFIENFLADDTGTADKNVKDDTAVLVDENGYIVNQQ